MGRQLCPSLTPPPRRSQGSEPGGAQVPGSPSQQSLEPRTFLNLPGPLPGPNLPARTPGQRDTHSNLSQNLISRDMVSIHLYHCHCHLWNHTQCEVTLEPPPSEAWPTIPIRRRRARLPSRRLHPSPGSHSNPGTRAVAFQSTVTTR